MRTSMRCLQNCTAAEFGSSIPACRSNTTPLEHPRPTDFGATVAAARDALQYPARCSIALDFADEDPSHGRCYGRPPRRGWCRSTEADMNGYQLTFYTEQNRRHGHHTVTEWLLHEAKQLGIHGATVINCAEGTGHAGAHHAAHALRLADQPVQIILAVTEEEAQRMLEVVI